MRKKVNKEFPEKTPVQAPNHTPEPDPKMHPPRTPRGTRTPLWKLNPVKNYPLVSWEPQKPLKGKKPPKVYATSGETLGKSLRNQEAQLFWAFSLYRLLAAPSTLPEERLPREKGGSAVPEKGQFSFSMREVWLIAWIPWQPIPP